MSQRLSTSCNSRGWLLVSVICGCWGGWFPASARAQQPNKVVVLPLEETSTASSDGAGSDARRTRARKMQAWTKKISEALTGFQASVLSSDDYKQGFESKDRHGRSGSEALVCGRECQVRLASRFKSDLVGGSISWQGQTPAKLTLWWWRVDQQTGEVRFREGGSEMSHRTEQHCMVVSCTDADFEKIVDQAAIDLADQVRRVEDKPPQVTPPVPPRPSPPEVVPPPPGTSTLPNGVQFKPSSVVTPAVKQWGLSNFSTGRRYAVAALTPLTIAILGGSIGLAALDAQGMTLGSAPILGNGADNGMRLKVNALRSMYGAGFALTFVWGVTTGFLLTAPSPTTK
ncbi:MAG: hypothetical protein U1A78_37960 [Polyangia bacterium]